MHRLRDAGESSSSSSSAAAQPPTRRTDYTSSDDGSEHRSSKSNPRSPIRIGELITDAPAARSESNLSTVSTGGVNMLEMSLPGVASVDSLPAICETAPTPVNPKEHQFPERESPRRRDKTDSLPVPARRFSSGSHKVSPDSPKYNGGTTRTIAESQSGSNSNSSLSGASSAASTQGLMSSSRGTHSAKSAVGGGTTGTGDSCGSSGKSTSGKKGEGAGSAYDLGRGAGRRHFTTTDRELEDEARSRNIWYDVLLIAGYFLGSTAVALFFTLLPLAEPTDGFWPNWLYNFVWLPGGLTVVACTFDTLANALFSDVHRPMTRRLVPIASYVAMSTTSNTIAGVAAGFPNSYGIIMVLLCNADFAMIYFSFTAEQRAVEGFKRRFFFYFLLANMFTASFLIHIVFFLAFRIAPSIVQMIMLVIFCGFNIFGRNVMMYFSGNVNPKAQHIGAYFQEYLSNFTLMLALPVTATIGVFVFTLFINLCSLITYPIRMMTPILAQQERYMSTFVTKALAPMHMAESYRSHTEKRLAAIRENLFRTYAMVGVGEVFASLAFIIIFPALGWGPQMYYYPFLEDIRDAGTMERALVYGSITVVVEVLVLGAMLAIVIRSYFQRSWRILIREAVCSSVHDAYFLFFAKLLVYLLAECILGLHYGSQVFMMDVFKLDIYPGDNV